MYNVLIFPLLYGGFHLLAWFHPKIRRGLQGRRQMWTRLKSSMQQRAPGAPVVLFHAASMGEYEQARPVIRELKQRQPRPFIVASVFSPSAFEHISGQPEPDALTYLPVDGSGTMRRFLDLLSPAAIVIVRHDLWPNLLWLAHERGIFTFLIDASVHPGSIRHRWGVRHFYRLLFRSLSAISAISEKALEDMRYFLEATQRTYVHGDTRFDQVVYRARERRPEELLPPWVLDWKGVWVAGSTWPEDEEVVLPAFARVHASYTDLKLILVPHEPTQAHIAAAEHRLTSLGLRSIRLSQAKEPCEVEVLIVDRIGILANLYAVGRFAFVGGSFGPGVHSVIEAAAHGLPVLFGPRMRNSAEAVDMVLEGCGFVVHDADECQQRVEGWLQDTETLRDSASRAREFVVRRTGASCKIADILLEQLIHQQTVVS